MVIVDLAVEDDPAGLVAIGHRLVGGGGDVDDRQPGVGQGDGAAGDLGYPSTVQLADKTIVTVLYYASGSETSGDWGNWGEVSCQALRYREESIR